MIDAAAVVGRQKHLTREGTKRSRDAARAVGDLLSEGTAAWRLASTTLFDGEPEKAAAHAVIAEQRAEAAEELSLAIRAQLTRAGALQAQGQVCEARELAESCAAMARLARDEGLLAQSHWTLVLLYTWTGPLAEARRHGELAIEHAARSGDRHVAWAAHWAMAVMAGLSGNVAGLERHVRSAEGIAAELASALLSAETAEVSIEHASAVGQWEEGLAVPGKHDRTARHDCLTASERRGLELAVAGPWLLEQERIPMAEASRVLAEVLGEARQ